MALLFPNDILLLLLSLLVSNMTPSLGYSVLGLFPLGSTSALARTAKSAALYLLIISSLLLVPDGIPFDSNGIQTKAQPNSPLAADSSLPSTVPSCTFGSGVSRVAARGASCPGVHRFYGDSRASQSAEDLAEFDPPALRFQQQPVGQHTERTILIRNHSRKRVLHLTSVSGTSSDFHPSFFRSEYVLPGEHTSFDVYFLPREVGPVESTLHIHTEEGFTFPLPVSGAGTLNPYLLRSLSARIPLNYSYSPTISLYNPHSEPLQITEMYSTAEDLHLELLASDAPGAWQVPPYQSKPVMRLNFFADRLDRYTAFIRVKTNFDRETGAQLIIPLEVEVVSRECVVSTAQELDFGLIRSSDELKHLNITLYNPSESTVRVTSLSATGSGRCITTQLFAPALLEPGTVLCVGVLKLQPRELPLNLTLLSGSVKINVTSGNSSKRQSNAILIPYRARIEYGHLNIPNLNLHSGSLPSRPQTVSVWLSHTFRYPLAVLDAMVSYPEADGDNTGYLSLHEFHWPLLIVPHDRVVVLSLRFMPNRARIMSHPHLHLSTNTSRFQIPIHIYSQQLELREGAEELEFGVIHPNITKNHSIKVRNLNADMVTVREMIIENPHLSFEKMVILPLQEGQLISMTGTLVPFVIQSNHEATLHYKLTRPTSGDNTSEVILVTDHQRLHLRVHYRSISGTLEAQRIIFQPSFPGHVEKRDIIIRNTFTQTVRVLDLRRVDPTDPRLYLEDPSIGSIDLSAFSSTHIAKLAFDPTRGFPGKVFTGGYSDAQSADWLNSLDLRDSAPEVDTRLYERMQAVWKECQNDELTKAVANFELDTDLVSGIKIEVEASLQWPSITPDAPILFPLTLIGNYSTQSVPIFNPGDLPLVVQALLLHFYPDQQAALDIVDDWLDIPSAAFPRISPFSLLESSSRLFEYQESPHPASYLASLDRSVSDLAWTRILPPKSFVNITVVFEPHNEEPVFSVILVRNNLTVMDAVVVQGAGAEGKFSLGGNMPDSDASLFFNITQGNLAECNSTDQISPSALSLTRTFTARNQGQLAIHIESLSINGNLCQGYGFSIRQCKPFTLKPNSSVDIDITFTPDFTLYYIHRELVLKTRHGQKLLFKLHAVIPAEFLPLCSRVCLRASWEPYLPYFTIPVLLGALVLAIYLSLQPDEDDIFSIPIPGMRNSYSAEGMDKVFKLASMFSFCKGPEEDADELKRKLDSSNALVKNIVSMHREGCSEQEENKKHRLAAIISPMQSPLHQDLMDIMHSSYVPDLSFRVSNGSSSGFQQDSNVQNGVSHVSSPQKTSVVKPIQVLEKESQMIRPIGRDVKQNSSISPQYVRPVQKNKTDQSLEIKPISKCRVDEKKERSTKPDLKIALPSNDVSSDIESRKDSPTTPPAAESKKAFQASRSGKYKKSKSAPRTRINKGRKDKSKPDRPFSSTSSSLDVQSQDLEIQDSLYAEENEERLSDAPLKPIDLPTKMSVPPVGEISRSQLTTPPKGPLPIHLSISQEGSKCTKGNREYAPDQSRVRDVVNKSSMPLTLLERNVQKQLNVNSVSDSINGNVLTGGLVKKDTENAELTRATRIERNPTQIYFSSSKELKVNINQPEHMPASSSLLTTVSRDTNDPKEKDKALFSCNIQPLAKEELPNYETKTSKVSLLTNETTKQSTPEIAVDQPHAISHVSNEKGQRLSFSGMSAELKQRIEEVCAPLTFDAPHLTGETHEQLSSILSTDAEPFVPDANVLRKLLEKCPTPQALNKNPKRSQAQSGLLDPKDLAKLTVILQNQPRPCLPQDEYINLLANSLGMSPRVLTQHVQYCWLCYHCNLMNVFGGSSSVAMHQASLDIPSLFKQIQEIGAQPYPVPEPLHNAMGILDESHPSKLAHQQEHSENMNSSSRKNLDCLIPKTQPSSNCSHGKQAVKTSPNPNKNTSYKANNLPNVQSEVLGNFSHWKDPPKATKPANNWNLSQREENVTRSHEDVTYYYPYEERNKSALSCSDPCKREKGNKEWHQSTTKHEHQPPSLSESELLPTELMTSRPPSPSSELAAKEDWHPRAQAPAGQHPLLFLENNIWSNQKSVTEEDRIKSWQSLTGDVTQQGERQYRDLLYNPFGDGSWGPLEDKDKHKMEFASNRLSK